MDFNEYQKWANGVSSLRNVQRRETASRSTLELDDTRVIVGDDSPKLDNIASFRRVDHAVAGIASESGEIAEHIKHVRFQGKALDRDHLTKEAGDLLWYIAELAAGLGVTLEDIAQRNIEKLKKRYPEGHFTVERSENRKPEEE